MRGHSRYAGMYCLNHWIPAFAGMTDEVDFGFRQAAPGILGGLCLSPLSFQRKLAYRDAGGPAPE